MGDQFQETGDMIKSMDKGCCEQKTLHTDVIEKVKNRLPGEDDIRELAEFFKIFGDATRISILWSLSEAELCVCDLCELLKMKQPAVSHQLRTLRQSRIVKSRREGKNVYYSLDDEHIHQLLDFSIAHLKEK